ncbi:hypothetical protein CK203_052415 [Vitis vinifera]|uniref:Retrotransposon gag domain-containing protein n=1 Tax=Vitis vinifera TaxID=29760 RepID=A0A438H6B3_VITVI|nr:hypothetical protein CK203_052415 [Vitis vinifera]
MLEKSTHLYTMVEGMRGVQGFLENSRDLLYIANMEARLAMVKLAMADTRERVDLIEQGMEKGLEDMREQIQDLCEGVLGSQVQPVSHEEFMSFQDKVMSMFTSVESRVEALAVHMEARDQEIRQELAIYKTVVSAQVMATSCGTKSGDEATKIKRQFYPEDVAYLARKNMKRLKHTGLIHEYAKEFSTLMLEIPNMFEEKLLFNFMDNLQSWAEQELRRHGVQDLATAMAVAESLVEYKGEISPSPSHSPRARDCPKRKDLNVMILEKEKKGGAHVGSLQLLNALKAKPVPKTPQSKGLMYVEALVNGKATKALMDTSATHNFVSKDEVKRLELQASKEGGRLHCGTHGLLRDGTRDGLPTEGQGYATTLPTHNGYPRGEKPCMVPTVTKRKIIDRVRAWNQAPCYGGIQDGTARAEKLRRQLKEFVGCRVHSTIQGSVWRTGLVLEKTRWVPLNMYRLPSTNKVTVKNKYPIPLIADLFDQLGRADNLQS